jgi:hypothetical protein
MKKNFLLFFAALFGSFATTNLNAQLLNCDVNPNLQITSPAAIAGFSDISISTTWGGTLTTSLSDTLVLFNDGIAATGGITPFADTYSMHDACTPALNDISGKIAVITRGSCTFVAKAQAAQDSGAVAVIIINHTLGGGAMAMGGSGTAITIPVVSLSREDGQALLDQLLAGSTVVGNLIADLDLASDVKIQNCGPVRFRDYATPLSQFPGFDPIEDTMYLGTIFYNNGLDTFNSIAIETKMEFKTLGGTTSTLFTRNDTIDLGSYLGNDEESGFRWDVLTFLSQNPATDKRGEYKTTYTLPADDNLLDNSSSQKNIITDKIWSKCAYAEDASLTLAQGGNSGIGGQEASHGAIFRCFSGTDLAGNDLAIEKVQFRCWSPDSLNGQIIQVSIYEWDDINQDSIINNTEIGDGTTIANPLRTVIYNYTDNDNLLNREVTFSPDVKLTAGKTYVLDVKTLTASINIYADVATDYSGNFAFSLEPSNQSWDPADTSANAQLGNWRAASSFAALMILGIADTSNAITENNINDNISVFPNPTSNMVTVEITNNNFVKGNIEVLNSVGQVVINVAITNNKNTINTSKLADGVYYIKTTLDDKMGYKKLMVKH